MQTDELLRLWRQTHHPEVRAALERVSDDALHQLPPLEGTSERRIFERWLELASARRSTDVPLLLQTLFDGPTTQVSRRLEALERFPEDPRIGQAAAEALIDWDDTAYDAGEVRVVARLFDVLVQHGFEGAPDLHQTYVLPKFSVQWPRLKVAIAARPLVELTPAQRAQLHTVQVGASPAARLAQASSGDARAVAIDALLEAGGPRAEFITLQQTRRQRLLTTKERAREEALRKRYARSWLGRLAKVMNHEDAVFSDGLLTEGWVWGSARELEALRDAPEWGTLRRLEFNEELSVPLLQRWPNITEVQLGNRIGLAALQELASASPPLGIAALEPSFLLQPRLGGLAALQRAPGLPALERIEVSSEVGFPDDQVRALFASKLGKRLKSLVFWGGEFELRALVRRLASAPRALQHARLARRAGGWVVDLERPFTTATLSFVAPRERPRAVFEALLEHLRALPRGVVKRWVPGVIEAPSAPLQARLLELLR